MLDWSVVLCFIGLIVILGLSVILYYKQVKSTKEMNKKLNSLVDQINKSNLYEYKFDTEQNGNIKNNDQNITNLNNAVIEAQKSIKYYEQTSLNKNDIETRLKTANVQTNTLNLGNKFSLSGVGGDNWLNLYDKEGKTFYGGFAAKNLLSYENTWLNGNTQINGSLKICDAKGQNCRTI